LKELSDVVVDATPPQHAKKKISLSEFRKKEGSDEMKGFLRRNGGKEDTRGTKEA
jgi:hypothetical protein